MSAFGVGIMHRFRAAAILAALLLVLSACAAPEIPYDRSTAGEIKTIGVVTPRFPSGPAVVLASSVGQSFGLIGALVDAGLQARRESRFQELLVSQNYSVVDDFTATVVRRLREGGYNVTLLPATRDGADFLKQYPAGSGIDAYLDLVSLGYGYIAAGIGSSTPYRPALVVRARLVAAKDSSVLMQDLIVYNPINKVAKAVTIAPDPAYEFVDFDTLVGDPATATKGLQTAVDQSAQAIATLLK